MNTKEETFEIKRLDKTSKASLTLPSGKESSINTDWLIGVLIVFVVWEISARVFFEIFLPPLIDIGLEIFRLLLTRTYWGHIFSSLKTIMLGFSISIVLGVVSGILIAFNTRIKQIVTPIIDFIRGIPAISLLPVFVLFFGLGLTPKLVVIVWIVWPSVLFNTIEGLESIDNDLIGAGRTMGATKVQIFRYIRIPLAIPNILTGMRIAVSYSWLSIVAAEMIGSSSGLGFAVQNYAQTFNIKQMYATIFIIGFLSLGSSSLFGLLYDKSNKKYN